MNQLSGFLVLLTTVGPHLVHPRGIAELRLAERAAEPIEPDAVTPLPGR